MKYSGLYFISNPSAQIASSEALTKTLTTHLEHTFPRANREDSGAWTLYHRLFRDIPPTNTSPDTNYAYSYQHLFRLSHLDLTRAYNYVQRATAGKDSGVIISLPAEQLDAHYALLANQWSQSWSPQRALHIPASVPGVTYAIGEFTVHIGELRMRRSGPQTASTLSPGVVVCITTTAGSPDDTDVVDAEIDFEDVQARIKEIWRIVSKDVDFAKSEIREVLQVPLYFGGDEEKGREAVVRMWCEALKLRG